MRFIPFDYMVVGTGSRCLIPFKVDTKSLSLCVFPYTASSVLKNYSRYLSAKKMIVIGGGPTGIELAGELAHTYKNAKIILLHKHAKLTRHDNDPKGEIHKLIIKQLARFKNLHVSLGKNVVEVKEGVIYAKKTNEENAAASNGMLSARSNSLNSNNSTSTGETYDELHVCDAIFVCCGLEPRTECFNNMMSSSMDQKSKQIIVNDNLQVAINYDEPTKCYNNIFACGDIIKGPPEEKLAQVAMLHASTVANNIKLVDKSKPQQKLEKHKIVDRIQIISTGQGKAVMRKGDSVITEGFFSSKIKAMLRTKVMYGVKETLL